MKGTLSKLGKLKGRGAAEWRVRGRQALASLAERARVSPQTRLPGGAALLRLFAVGPEGSAPRDAEALLEHFRRRTSPRFFASFDDRRATAAEWRRRFGAEEAELVRRADEITAGRFRLLGHEGLRFGDGPAPDWHLEPLAGRRAPLAHWSRVEYLNPEVAGDKKVVWELNRHQHFLTLGRAYFLTGDERYAATFAAHLRSWAAANPPKVGINWASSLEAAFRSISWLWALHFFRESERLTPDLFTLAAGLLRAHARHVETYLSTYFSPNTHLTGEALGLYYVGTLLPELRDARRWRETGLRVLAAELERQVRPDGTYFEQASYYQRYTADFCLHLLALAARNEDGGRGESSSAVARRLEPLLDHLMHVTRPDGRATLYGDDDGGRLAPLDSRPADDFRPALSTGAVLAGRGDYKFVAGELAEETFWLLGPEGASRFDQLEAREPAEMSRAFPDGGVYVMRDGWGAGASYMLVDCGPHGALSCGHSHADALSFELVARGRALVVDPGTYTYTGSAAERDRFRSTAAHNTLVLDGRPSSEPAGPFSWHAVARARARAWISRPRFDYFEGEHDGYERPPAPATHRRAVLFLKGDYFVVRDHVDGEGAHRAELRFQLAPGPAPAIEGGRVTAGGEARADIHAFGGGAWRVEEGRVSRCYGAREAAPALVYEARIEGGAEFFTLLVPAAAGEAAPHAAHEASTREARESDIRGAREIGAAGGRAFELTRRAGHDLLLAGGGGRTVEAGGLASDFELAWARFARGGELLEAVLVGGKRLALGGRAVVVLEDPAPFVHVRREGGEFVVETDTSTARSAARDEGADAPTAGAGASAGDAEASAGGSRSSTGRPASGDEPAAVHAGAADFDGRAHRRPRAADVDH
ncbi:MAG TPA: alginate lyase family protein [Pyrinomonadaceae bacterium]|nr:alginate lyase family protein [Pyrinomonadaceae bacterium]